MSMRPSTEAGHPDRRVVLKQGPSKPRRRWLPINPTWIAFLAGLGVGKVVDWVFNRNKEIDMKSIEEQAKLASEVTAVAHGPWGGRGGKEFYDGRGEIVGITVHYNDNAVISLQATYEQGGARFHGTTHGGIGGESAKINLNYPFEYLKQVVGTTAQDTKINHTEGVTSLTFVTNKQTYGPYGKPRGQNFQSPATGVVGFYGRSGALLDQLGVLNRQ